MPSEMGDSGPSTSSQLKQPPFRSSRSATASPTRSMRGTQDSIAESLPPPKAKHTLDNVDPDYLGTAASAYREKQGIGLVYDHTTHRRKNEELAKKKEEKRRADAVVDAAKKDIAYQSVSDKAFDDWKAMKRLEKEMQSVIKISASVQEKKQGAKVVSKEEITKRRQEREAKWMSGFGSLAEMKAKNSPQGTRKDSSDTQWRPTNFY